MKNEKNIHDGHRQRLLDTIARVGIDNVSDIQAVEFVLTYIFPRGDTNPLAHRLLERFSSLAYILDADINDLMSVPGINERAAKKLTMLPEILTLYANSKFSKKERLRSLSEIFDFIEDNLRLKKTEEILIVALDPSFYLMESRILGKGNFRNVAISQNELLKFLISFSPAHVFIVHNHPGGSAVPSKNDVDATVNIKNLITSMGIDFVDHFVVGIDGIFSIKENKFLREFSFN